MKPLDYASSSTERPAGDLLAYMANGILALSGVAMLIIILANDGGYVRLFDGLACVALGAIQLGITVATAISRPHLKWFAWACLAIPVSGFALCMMLPYRP